MDAKRKNKERKWVEHRLHTLSSSPLLCLSSMVMCVFMLPLFLLLPLRRIFVLLAETRTRGRKGHTHVEQWKRKRERDKGMYPMCGVGCSPCSCMCVYYCVYRYVSPYPFDYLLFSLHPTNSSMMTGHAPSFGSYPFISGGTSRANSSSCSQTSFDITLIWGWLRMKWIQEERRGKWGGRTISHIPNATSVSGHRQGKKGGRKTQQQRQSIKLLITTQKKRKADQERTQKV